MGSECKKQARIWLKEPIAFLEPDSCLFPGNAMLVVYGTIETLDLLCNA
jgi:hypothetical protein